MEEERKEGRGGRRKGGEEGKEEGEEEREEKRVQEGEEEGEEEGKRKQRAREKKEEEENKELGEEAMADVVCTSDKTLGKRCLVKRSACALDPLTEPSYPPFPWLINVVLNLKFTQLLKRPLCFSEV